jgi:tetratricopeptide (TPR) repeat protein
MGCNKTGFLLMRVFLKSALMVGVGLAVWAQGPEAVAREATLSGTYLAGRTAARARDPKSAVEFFEKAITFDPANPQMNERLFQLRLSRGDIATAEKQADEILKFNSQHRMARLVKGIILMKRSDFAGARENFSEAAYTPMGELSANLLNAWTYAGEGSLNAALKELDKLDNNESFSSFKAYHQALIADYLKSGIRAEAAYKITYAQAGQSLRVTQAYGNYLTRQGRKDEAERVYRSFVEGSDGNVLVQDAWDRMKRGEVPAPLLPSPQAGAAEALFSIATAMNDSESNDVAMLYARLAAALEFDKPLIMTLLGDILASGEDHASAIAAYEAVDPKSPLAASARIQKAMSLQQADKGKEAQAELETLVKLEPKNVDVWLALGNIRRFNEDYKQADLAYAEAEKLISKPEKQHWQIYYFRGICNERLKNWADAESLFRKALKLSPEEASVLNYLGYTLIDRREKLEEAFEMVKKAVELKPNDGYITDSLGWAYYQIADFENAVIHLERAVELKASDPLIADHLGDAYWRVGRKLEAQFQWQHAKDNEPEPEDLKRIENKLKNGLTDPPPLPPKAAEVGAPKKG